MVRGWLGGAVLAGVLALAGCAAATGQSGAVPAQSAATAPLAYVAEDGHVYTIAPEGGDARRVDSVPGEQPVAGEVRLSRWPTWTPDGSRLAFMRLNSGEGDAPATAAIWTVTSDGSDPRRIWESEDQAPIYMAWSPDGSTLALLAQRSDRFALLLIDPSGGRPARTGAEGAPLYFAWSPDAAEVALHVSGDHRSNPRAELGVLRPGPSEERHPLGAYPADFRAPGWSHDGVKVAFVAEAPDRGAVLTVTDPRGGGATRLASLGEETAFLWSPAENRLAFSRRGSEGPFYRGLEIVRGDGGERTQVTQDPILAFAWSPDGTKLAFVGVDRQAQALAWFVSDPAGKNPKQVAQFLPSEDQLRLFGFFDQYAQSHSLWSPDSRFLIYAGSPPGSRGTPAESRRSQVFIVPADGSAEPKAVVDGKLAVWPVPPPRR